MVLPVVSYPQHHCEAAEHSPGNLSLQSKVEREAGFDRTHPIHRNLQDPWSTQDSVFAQRMEKYGLRWTAKLSWNPLRGGAQLSATHDTSQPSSPTSHTLRHAHIPE